MPLGHVEPRDAWLMPIANCFFAASTHTPDAEMIVSTWSKRSGVASGEMTVNVVNAAQGGKKYAVMAWLYLPSLWSSDDIVALSEGLAAALADVTGSPPSSVQVVTCIVGSGNVVEDGETLRW